MDNNLNAGSASVHHHQHHHRQGGGVSGGGCHGTPSTNNCTTTSNNNLPDHAVTVTVGGPMLHRSSASSFSHVGSTFHESTSSSLSNSGANSLASSTNPSSTNNQGGPGPPEINLNATVQATCSFEETKELLARHLRRCCDNNVTNNHNDQATAAQGHHHAHGQEGGQEQQHYQQHEANFEGLDLGGDDHTPVPLGDLLEKLQAETNLDQHVTSGDHHHHHGNKSSDLNDLIRLHSVEQNHDHPTISATVNVATLDLSDPESIHQHLSQLNDAVLRVTTDNSEDFFDNNTTTSNNNNNNNTNQQHHDGNHRNHHQSNLNTTISISIPSSAPGSVVATSSMVPSANCSNNTEPNKESMHSHNAPNSSISNSSTPLVSPSHTTTISPCPSLTTPTSGGSGSQQQQTTKPKTTPTSSPATPRKSGSSSGSKASPQSCSVCSKVFSNASALAKHRLTHSEERRYHCNICGKAFKRQDHLNGHLLTHRSTKPFACHVEGCGKSYCDARSLRRHKENHHGQAKAETTMKQSADNQMENSSTNNSSTSTKSSISVTGITPNAGSDQANANSNTNNADQIISKSVLGDTKIKFSSKGLTAQQLQLIEQLFKQTKTTKPSEETNNSIANDKTENSTNNNQGSTASSVIATNNTATTTTAAASIPPLNAAVVKKNDKPTPTLPDKPVECTICSRKFKNIPALNGHMRLHGGYYKKDADGRRLVGMANTSPLKTIMNNAVAAAVATPKSNLAAGNSKMQSSENLKRKASPGDLIGSDPQAKKGLTPTLSVTYCQPQVTSLPSFAFSNLPQPDTSKLLANLEQKTKQMMTSPPQSNHNHSTTTSDSSSSSTSATTDTISGSSTTTTTSLRAMRKPPSASTTANNFTAARKNTNTNQMITAASGGGGTPIMANHHPTLSLPIVALPTKPLPVQMESPISPDIVSNNETNKSLVQGFNNNNNGTSIQITALIQSSNHPNTGDYIGHSGSSMSLGSPTDFMVQASTQDCGLMNNLPLVNNMLSCMHNQQQNSNVSVNNTFGSYHHHHHNHHHHHHSSNKSPCTNLLKVDESSDKTPKIGSNYQAEIPSFVADVKPSERPGSILDVSIPIWQPETANSLSELEFNQYLVVASSCAVGGGSHNEEVALEILQKHGGNVQYALQDLLSTYDYEELDAMSIFSSPEEASDSEDDMTGKSGRYQPWQPYEVDLFYEGLVRYHKNFTKIARHVGTKSVKDCVEFYYLWKNICHEESESFKSLFAQEESSLLEESSSSNSNSGGNGCELAVSSSSSSEVTASGSGSGFGSGCAIITTSKMTPSTTMEVVGSSTSNNTVSSVV